MTRRILLFALLAFLLPPSLEAQSLPTFEKAGEVNVSRLPNGVSCYIVTNAEKKGFADFALVQKGVPDMDKSRKALSSLPHLGSRSPWKFVAAHGSSFGQKGCISYQPYSTRFDFPDMPVFEQTVVDTTLMMLFDLASTSRGEQAIIVSGDVTAASFLERLKTFSILLDRRDGTAPDSSYVWVQTDSLVSRIYRTASPDVAAVNLRIKAGRTAPGDMGTALSLVTRLYSEELGVIAVKRTGRALVQAGIPMLESAFSYDDSSSGPGDEVYSFRICVPAEYLGKASAIMGSVFAGLDSEGATLEEFRHAKSSVLSGIEEKSSRNRSNSEYVDQCAAAYLYGASLASGKTLFQAASRKSLDPETELSLFNSFVAALLDPSKNMFLRFDIPRDMPDGGFEKDFVSGWSDAGAPEFLLAGRPADISLQGKTSKIKVKSESAEPISGGNVWTFSNGVNVIFRKTSEGDRFDYAVQLRGGYADIPGLGKGEGVFVGDMLRLSRIAGHRWEEFMAMLETEGILLVPEVTVSDFIIRGSAPIDRRDLLFSSIAAIANDRIPDAEAFAAFRKKESYNKGTDLLYPRKMYAVLDSLVCPDYEFRENRSAVRPGSGLQQLAEEYFSRQFSKMGDGVIILSGNMEAEALKKDMCRILGAFSSKRGFSSRPVTEYPLYSGGATIFADSAQGVVGGAELGVYMQCNALLDFNMSSEMSFRIALELLRMELADVLARNGYYGKLTGSRDFFPKDRISVRIEAHPCYVSGLPYGMEPSSPDKVLDEINAMMERLAVKTPSAALLKACKSALSSEMKSLRGNRSKLMDTILSRYSSGKNSYVNYASAVESVSVAGIKNIFSRINEGSSADYVIE